MKIVGKLVYIGNHLPDNFKKMYEWSKNIELIELEAGNLDQQTIGIEDYKTSVMKNYIKYNPDSSESYCHFGICKRPEGRLVGYADLQYIDDTNKEAELSLSIPEKKNRSKGYGVEAALLVMHYAFEMRNIKTIIIRTRSNNTPVLEMLKKKRVETKEESVLLHGKNVELVSCKIDKVIYNEIKKPNNGFERDSPTITSFAPLKQNSR